MTPQVRYSSFPTARGPFYVAYADDLVLYTDYQVGEDTFRERCRTRFAQQPLPNPEPSVSLCQAVETTLTGRAPFNGCLAMDQLPAFYQRVLRITQEIPWGAVRPYGWLAREAGAPRAARAVGTAMAKNPFPLLIPCHRVVRSDYQIGNYGCGGPSIKRALLVHEGADPDALAKEVRAGHHYKGTPATGTFCLLGCSAQSATPAERRFSFSTTAEALQQNLRPCPVCKPL